MITPVLALVLAIAFGGTAVAQSSLIDLSTPMTGKSRFATEADGKPVEFGALSDGNTVAIHGTQQGVDGPSCGGSGYGAISCATGRPRTQEVKGYQRRDGTEVRSYYRSAPRGRR